MNNNAKIMVGEVQHNTKLNDLSNILKIRYIQMTKIQKGQYIIIINETKTERLKDWDKVILFLVH